MNKCIHESKTKLNSIEIDTDTKIESIVGVLHGLVLLNKDAEARLFINEQLSQNRSGEVYDFLRSIDANYSYFKKQELKSVKAFK